MAQKYTTSCRPIRFPKPLEVDNFPFSQELDDIVDIGIIRDPQDVVIGHAGLLLWYIGFNTK